MDNMAELKRVSFKVAKVIKEAGYPQEGSVHSNYYDEEHKETFVPFNCNRSRDYLAPTYLEVWMWLWREKRIHIYVLGSEFQIFMQEHEIGGCADNNDPEEAIIAAIEYLVNNKLIK